MHTATRCNTLGANLLEIMIIYIYCNTVQHIATRCNALQHTVQIFRAKPHRDYAHPYKLQHTATHCNILQQHCNTLCRYSRPNYTETMLIHNYCNTPATYCNILQQHCNTRCRYSGPHLTETMLIHVYCNTLQHTATHCNTLQHIATYCNNTATHCAGIRGQISLRLCSYFLAVPFLLPVVGW